LSISNGGSDDIFSPSLGITYKIEDKTLFQATAARGFIQPGRRLSVESAGYDGDPDRWVEGGVRIKF
jgi:outer membrane receptor protein involved in Fe transport